MPTDYDPVGLDQLRQQVQHDDGLVWCDGGYGWAHHISRLDDLARAVLSEVAYTALAAEYGGWAHIDACLEGEDETFDHTTITLDPQADSDHSEWPFYYQEALENALDSALRSVDLGDYGDEGDIIIMTHAMAHRYGRCACGDSLFTCTACAAVWVSASDESGWNCDHCQGVGTTVRASEEA